MTFCPMCGREVDEDHRYCATCGAGLRLDAGDGETSSTLPPGSARRDTTSARGPHAYRAGKLASRRPVAAWLVVVVVMGGLALGAWALVSNDGEPGCYDTALEYGDLARRVDAGRIDEISHRADLEIEDDQYRRAVTITINFVSTSKTLGGNEYPSRRELENFVRNTACPVATEE